MKTKSTTLDALRTFYIAEELLNGVILSSKGNKKVLRRKLKAAIKKAEKLSIDKLLTKNMMYGPRFDNYFNATWELKEIPLKDIGVWPRMGGLPDTATQGTVLDTANYLRPYLSGKKRIPKSVSQALYIKRRTPFADLITAMVPIIVFTGGVIRHNTLTPSKRRQAYKRCKYDIDDGNHRTISLALAGKDSVLALVGTRTLKNKLLYP